MIDQDDSDDNTTIYVLVSKARACPKCLPGLGQTQNPGSRGHPKGVSEEDRS